MRDKAGGGNGFPSQGGAAAEKAGLETVKPANAAEPGAGFAKQLADRAEVKLLKAQLHGGETGS